MSDIAIRTCGARDLRAEVPMKAVVGHAARRQVAFVGPFGVGKTTAVRSVSDTPVISTEVLSSTAVRASDGRLAKRMTTVGLDYGEWLAPDGSMTRVFGTPGQARFDTVRKSAAQRGTYLVLWVFGQNEYALDECAEWVEFLTRDTWARLTVAVTRLDTEGDHPPLDAYRPLLSRYRPDIPLLAADPRDRGEVERVLKAALRLDTQDAPT